MTRKYDTVEINGIMYEKHGVKLDKKPIGFVPVPAVKTLEDLLSLVTSGVLNAELMETDTEKGAAIRLIHTSAGGNGELVVDDWKYGNGVRLQQMARKIAGGEGFNDTIMGKIADELDADVFNSFHGNMAGLRTHCKEIYAQHQASEDDSYGKDYLWDELIQ